MTVTIKEVDENNFLVNNKPVYFDKIEKYWIFSCLIEEHEAKTFLKHINTKIN